MVLCSCYACYLACRGDELNGRLDGLVRPIFVNSKRPTGFKWANSCFWGAVGGAGGAGGAVGGAGGAVGDTDALMR